MGEAAAVVSAKNITKSFSGVAVLKNVDFDIYPGEVHSLIGENGAGKSTLMKIISGVYRPTSGELLMEGEPVHFGSPHDARLAGIALIHQEPLTFPDLNVCENIYLGHTREDGGVFINWKQKHREAEALLKTLGVKMRPGDPVRSMTIADQQMIEITSALSQNAKVIIMDEPTAALSHGEVRSLFETVKKLKEQGRAIVFIGHRLEEIMEISDRITVLRDGELAGGCFAHETDIDGLVRMMVGRTFKELIVKEETEIGEELLRVEHITYPGRYHDVSLTVRRGEIVGMSGLVGAGRSDVAAAVFGTAPAWSGTIKIRGKKVEIKSPAQAMKNGVAMVSEDRARTGLILPLSISENMSFAVLKAISRGGYVDRKREKELVDKYVDYLHIKLRSPEQPVGELSGGNQQKVVIAKWLATEPDILILDEPTRGIDVGAKAEVYKLISELAKQGKAILMISSELPEILQLSDRVYVMCEGSVVAELERAELDSERIMAAASGTHSRKEAEG